MNKQKIYLGSTALLLASSILACNFQAATLTSEEQPQASLSPPPTAEFQLEDPFGDSPYFVEEFSARLPESWIVSSGWNIAAGSLSTSSGDAELVIPGDWQEFSLILQLRVGSGGAVVDFNNSPEGLYSLIFSRAELSLDWQPTGAESEVISTLALDLASGWHNLVLTQKQGSLFVTLDGETLLDGLTPGYSPTGYFRLSKTGPGTLEIDRLVIGPPGDRRGRFAPTGRPLRGLTEDRIGAFAPDGLTITRTGLFTPVSPHRS